MRIKTLFEALVAIGHSPDDNEDVKLQKRFLICLALFMSVGGIIWGAITIFYDLYFQSVIPLGYVLLSCFNMLYFYFSKNYNRVRNFQIFISLILPFLFQWSLGGFQATGSIMLWSSLALIASLSFQRIKVTMIWLGLFIALTIFSAWIDPYLIDHMKPAILKDFSLLFTVLNITTIITIVFGLTVYLIYGLQSAQKKLRKNKLELEEKNQQV